MERGLTMNLNEQQLLSSVAEVEPSEERETHQNI